MIGHFYAETGTTLKALGNGFIKLIRIVIAPIIFCTVVTGIAGMRSMKTVGKTGGYEPLYFNVVQPGVGVHIDPSTLHTVGLTVNILAVKAVVATISTNLPTFRTTSRISPKKVLSFRKCESNIDQV